MNDYKNFFGSSKITEEDSRGQTSQCSMNGRWISSKEGTTADCRHFKTSSGCGELICSTVRENMVSDQDNGIISGKNCDKLEIFGMKGQIVCGLITWIVEEGIHDAWYKHS
ncbi:unnamed protein product [Dracunculus medinensis]|uniref:SRCR domain-containing protein n=1 Tax=Dracunculus medinensis TaxID=318479 RepID=A0A0N4UHA4_DRAME|nr:unnamed protein product [Dracunculus medinensis]